MAPVRSRQDFYTTALFDRLFHYAIVVRIKGTSYHLRC
jgi:hypothetical protein